MRKLSAILSLFSATCLLSACASLGLEDKTQTYGGKFTGKHSALARCVVDSLRSDSRWVISGMQYDIRRYPDIEATEIYAYALGSLPGTYARNSPTNPDAVVNRTGPVPQVRAYTGTYTGPEYLFDLMIQRTDNATVVARLNGKKYESDIAWEKLKACSAP